MLKFLKKLPPVLWLTVVAPTLVAIFYFGILASDVYISESRFVVRSAGKGQTSALGAILGSAGIGSLAGNMASDETSSVIEYVRSRDAVNDLERQHLLTKAYGNTDISWFDRFGGPFRKNTEEHLFDYYEGKVLIETDSVTGVTRLIVHAFSPTEAQAINLKILEHSESLVNRLNSRSRRDTIALAAAEVEEAKTRAREAAVELSRYRNSQGLVDPQMESQIGLQMIAKLQDELIASRARLAQLQAYTPENSQIPAVRTQVQSIEKEIRAQSAGLAGGRNSLSSAAVQYQQLQINSQVADKQLAVALASLQEAKVEARKKHSYVERISQPNLPDYPLEPRRLRSIFATFILGLLAWGVLTTLLAGIKEHQD